MKRLFAFALVAGVSLAAFSSCTNDPTITGGSGCTTGCNLNFVQIDRVGKPNTFLIFVPFASGNLIAITSPSVDAAGATNLTPLVTNFTTGFAGRSTATAAYVASIYSPDVLVADFSQSGDAEYLGEETAGAAFSPVGCGVRSGSGLFGGRALIDDAFRTDLNMVFGNGAAVASAGTVPDDGKEQAGLANDNVGCGAKHFNFTAFPYLGTPL